MVTSPVAQIGFSAAAAAAAAWAAVRYLGKSWVDDRFKRGLADQQFAHDQQIEALKLDLDTLRNRIAKLNDQEFVVLPEVWIKMAEALGAIISASDPKRTLASAMGMNEGELEAYLATAPLLEWEKGEIRNFPNTQQPQREASLHNKLDWANYRQARALTDEFRRFLPLRRIFMTEALAGELDRCADMIDSAVTEFRRFLEGRQTGNPIELTICPTLKAESTRISAAVRKEIQVKLFGGAV